jgi:hypothetical protein
MKRLFLMLVLCQALLLSCASGPVQLQPVPVSPDSVRLTLPLADGVLDGWITAHWDSVPQGVLFDPVPNPQKYLVVQVDLWLFKLSASLDLGRPGWGFLLD